MKIFKFFVCLLLPLLIISCNYDPQGYLKRSANNKLLDAKGFQKTKRMPLYNKKYIQRAEQNIKENNIQDEDDDVYAGYESDEVSNYSKVNEEIYEDMLRMQETKQRLGNKKQKYPTVSEMTKQLSNPIYNNEETTQLRNELSQLKQMLKETRELLAKYKCQKCNTSESESPNNQKTNNQKNNLLAPEINREVYKDPQNKVKQNHPKEEDLVSILIKSKPNFGLDAICISNEANSQHCQPKKEKIMEENTFDK